MKPVSPELWLQSGTASLKDAERRNGSLPYEAAFPWILEAREVLGKEKKWLSGSAVRFRLDLGLRRAKGLGLARLV